jgi:hypothetical protein
MKYTIIPYYQNLKCHSYYREGVQTKLEKGILLIMLGYYENGLHCIVQGSFQAGDVLILNIHLDGYPYEKLMCHVQEVTTEGEYQSLYLEIMGIPNSLNEKMKKSLAKAPSSSLELTEKEKSTLKKILDKLIK